VSRVRFSRTFTEQADAVVSLATHEAQRNSVEGDIGTEHVLLALLHQEDTIACAVLSNMGVDPIKMEDQLDNLLQRGDRVVRMPGLTPRARKVIALAIRETGGPDHWPATTGHILLGLLAEGEGIAASVLRDQGLTVETVRAEVARVLETQDEV